MSIKILIIEDEIELQDVYKLILESKGYEVFTANDGLKALLQLKSVIPDMILLDLFMPNMDGKEFLRNLDLSDYPEMKIVVYTNLSDQNIESEMLGLGAHKFILKSSMAPQDLIQLTEEVTNTPLENVS